MNRLLTVSGMIALSTVVSHAALADTQRWPNWYVGVSGGVAFLDNSDLSGAATGKLNYSTGGMGTVSLGYAPPATMQPFSNMRFEAEFGYHDSPLNSAIVNNVATLTSGSMQSMSYMGNVYYDFRNATGWTPYVGAGAGGAHVDIAKSSGLGNTSNSNNVFAYQFMAGISYAPKSIPLTEWSLGYRYFAEDSPSFNTAAGKIKVDSPKASDVEVGARFRF